MYLQYFPFRISRTVAKEFDIHDRGGGTPVLLLSSYDLHVAKKWLLYQYQLNSNSIITSIQLPHVACF